ncbi:MAG: glutathione S-transferase family protein [Gammaproteobacteria bacterium]|jgi:glutathione S-transferase
MYTLFWEYGSGSIVVQGLLEELEAKFVRQYVDMEAGENEGSEYLGYNPTGMVPALQLPDGNTIGETAAIVLHLGEQFADSTLVPQAGDRDRPEFLYWLAYLASTGYVLFARMGHPERFVRGQDDLEPVRIAAAEDMRHFFAILERGIAAGPFFLERGYTALDIYLTMLAGWHPDRDALFGENPRIASLVEAVEGRPAYRKTIAEHAPALASLTVNS